MIFGQSYFIPTINKIMVDVVHEDHNITLLVKVARFENTFKQDIII